MKFSDIEKDEFSVDSDLNLKITDFENFFDIY